MNHKCLPKPQKADKEWKTQSREQEQGNRQEEQKTADAAQLRSNHPHTVMIQTHQSQDTLPGWVENKLRLPMMLWARNLL